MKIRFWGVRGSIPTPMSPRQMQSRISSIIQRIKPGDLASQDDRERFLANLPDFLFSAIGGNTACVEVETGEDCRIIFDAGTGIRDLGTAIASTKRPSVNNVFFSHFHWDHIQGLPYFAPAFDPASSVIFHSPVAGFARILADQMRYPYFPVTMDVMRAPKTFVELAGQPVLFGGVSVEYRKMSHPGGCYSYVVRESGKKIIYSTDTELQESDFLRTRANEEYFQDADALIIDSQYTLGEAIEKYNWGHSSFSLAADFAVNWKIKRLILFHFEPSYTDKKIFNIFKSAAWYIGHLENASVEVILAREGLEVDV
ncbi:MAG: MBL fold metallo-hydrolase [Spirochaetes bacterium]|nr:MBL fold metallo-hydrolase [Spirochaetota bacterium]